MGYWKEVQIKIAAGFADPRVTNGRAVCSDCFEDAGLKSYIRSEATETTCDFCNATSTDPIAADLEKVVDHIALCMHIEWDDPNNEVGWDHGWVGAEIYDTWEALESADVLTSETSGDLFDVIVDSLQADRQYCRKNPYSLREEERLIGGWRALADRLKYERRFFFFREDEDSEYVSPSQILQRLGIEVSALGLDKTLPAGTRLYRVRYQPPGSVFDTAATLGPPPREFATKSNRISPPGVVMTYLAEDIDTALAETKTDPGDYAVGTFELLSDVTVVNLSGIEPVPSLYDGERNVYRSAIKFLRDFADDISQPIAHDDRVHIDYIPTQVVTEYFREVFGKEHFPVNGLRYTSAPRPTHASVVLFADRSQVEGTDEHADSGQPALLRLIHSTVVTVP